jgi:hypothetical protein
VVKKLTSLVRCGKRSTTSRKNYRGRARAPRFVICGVMIGNGTKGRIRRPRPTQKGRPAGQSSPTWAPRRDSAAAERAGTAIGAARAERRLCRGGAAARGCAAGVGSPPGCAATVGGSRRPASGVHARLHAPPASVAANAVRPVRGDVTEGRPHPLRGSRLGRALGRRLNTGDTNTGDTKERR